MKRATTPKHVFALTGISARDIKKLKITYQQCGETIVEKNTADATISDSEITVTLTQQETNKFREDVIVEVQLRVLTTENVALASDIFKLKAERVLNAEVMT